MPLGIPSAGDSLLEDGQDGLGALQSKWPKSTGQITLVNGSANILGVGTTGFPLSPDGTIAVVDSAGDVYFLYIAEVDPTHATISICRKNQLYVAVGDTANFAGVSGTYDFYQLIAYANGRAAIAVGPNASAVGNDAVAVGEAAAAVGVESTAFGPYASAIGSPAVAVGSTSVAIGEGAQAFGSYVTASAAGAVAIGYAFENNVANSVALGIYDGAAKVLVRATDKRCEVLGAAGDVVLASPDGTRWKIGVSNLGVVTVAAA